MNKYKKIVSLIGISVIGLIGIGASIFTVSCGNGSGGDETNVNFATTTINYPIGTPSGDSITTVVGTCNPDYYLKGDCEDTNRLWSFALSNIRQDGRDLIRTPIVSLQTVYIGNSSLSVNSLYAVDVDFACFKNMDNSADVFWKIEQFTIQITSS